MRQPISTITNSAFIIAGLYVWSQAPFVAATLIALGIASGAYHWTKTRMWQYIDLWCIFLVFVAITENHVLGTFILSLPITAGLSWLHYHRVFRSWYMVGSVAGATMVIHAITADPIMTLYSILWFAMGMGVHVLSERGPHGLHDVGHAFWHIAAAAGIYLLV